MDIKAEAKYIKMSPRKVRLVAEAIKKLSPEIALAHLALMPKRAAGPVALVLKSALANATNNAKLSADALRIKSVVVGGGPALKRWQPVSRGRAHPYKKRMSHITVILSDDKSSRQLRDPAAAEQTPALPAGRSNFKSQSSNKKGKKE